jgi:CRP/FNR family transcriptional regulator, nitrogen fixation regulation protein
MEISSATSFGQRVERFSGDSSPETAYESLQQLAVVARYDTDQPIYRYNDPAHYWFRMVAGAARKTALSGDGRRHIVDFLLPGDFFGFCASSGYHFCVEAIVAGSLVARYPRRSAERLADSDPQVARRIRQATFESIARLQRLTSILAGSSALEKVGAFLLDMANRTGVEETRWVCLPMSRYDIADYLAMAVETVSRTLTELRARRAIAYRDARRVQICDRGMLERVPTGWAGRACR